MDPTPSPPTKPATPAVGEPEFFEAIRRFDGSGAVRKGARLTVAQAVAARQASGDVVVCGPNATANYWAAYDIERQVGPCIDDKAHRRSAGPLALRHFHQVSRNPTGHTFYEQPPTRTAV